MSVQSTSIDRISTQAQQWFLSEPLLFAIWTTHRVTMDANAGTVRVGRGQICFHPQFVSSLDDSTLREVMRFEAVRIALKHPYERRKPSAPLAYEASNLAIQECLRTRLPMPSAQTRFATDAHDAQHFEYYYRLLGEDGVQDGDGSDASAEDAAGTEGPDDALESSADIGRDEESAELWTFDLKDTLRDHCNAAKLGAKNAFAWDDDAFLCEQIDQVIEDVRSSQDWGSMAGNVREAILATLLPQLDYREMLRGFRATILASRRRLTRMKPSRRYEFQHMGSRREFCTRLLFAVDVSGSVGKADVRRAFSIVNRLFQYGVESIDVLWFDTQIRNTKPLTLKRAAREFHVDGRGGTNFQPLMDYLDEHLHYDGMILFTDGIAPMPKPPQRNHRTRVFWLFNSMANWRQKHDALAAVRMHTSYVRG